MKMSRCSLVLAVLVLKSVWAQAPSYTADSITNASDYSPGPFAPNSVLSIFGSNLSWYTQAFASQSATSVPVALSGVEVYVDNWPAPLLYVSASQINFLIPCGEIPGSVSVHVVREGVSGPFVSLTLVDAAPALFEIGSGFAIATHADGTVLTHASPGLPGEIVVVYATGLGATDPIPEAGEIPETAAPLQWLSTLSISLNGAALPSALIKYAGATPGCVGLYQLNMQLPQDLPADPVIQVSMGTRSNSVSLKIAVR